MREAACLVRLVLCVREHDYKSVRWLSKLWTDSLTKTFSNAAKPNDCSVVRVGFAVFAVAAFFSVIGTTPVIAAGKPIPPFVAEGTVSVEVFSAPPQSKVMLRMEAHVSFCYSNGWWQAECKYTAPSNMVGLIENCRRLPDGIRQILTSPENARSSREKVMPSAMVFPIAFPPPEKPILFTAWLTLCPTVELPIIDARHMRRLIAREQLDHPKNIGTYLLKTIQPQNLFISDLAITNNGVDFGPGLVPISRRGALAQGYLESMYTLQETTNVSGIIFPLRARYSRFAPLQDAPTASSIFPVLTATVSIERFGSMTTGCMNDSSVPERFVALDKRFGNLPQGTTVNHYITNDHWLLASDPRMLRLREGYKGPPRAPWKRYAAVVVLAITCLLPAGFLFYRKRYQNKQHQQNTGKVT